MYPGAQLEDSDLCKAPLFLPYLSGERSPYNDPQASGCFFNLRHETNRALACRWWHRMPEAPVSAQYTPQPERRIWLSQQPELFRLLYQQQQMARKLLP